MRLSKFTDYALRVMIYLASRPGEVATIDDIAGTYAISKDHLRKVVHQLSQMDWVDSRRGRGGGLTLARDPGTISVGAVVRSMEENLAIVECFEPDRDTCRISGVCRLQGMLGEALSAFFSVLDRYTLDDIVTGDAALLARLGVPAPLTTVTEP